MSIHSTLFHSRRYFNAITGTVDTAYGTEELVRVFMHSEHLAFLLPYPSPSSKRPLLSATVWALGYMTQVPFHLSLTPG
jgi:hypothetical protein